MRELYKKIKFINQVKIDNSYDFTVEDEHRIIARESGSKNSFYTSNCHHPDIEEFITAKQTPGRLTKFNMSVLITDDFINCVKNNLPWNLEFPDYEKHKEVYKKYWNGDIKSWKARGLSTVVYKTFENANELWNIIMESTYCRNEPGVLFIDTINNMNNLKYCEFINATNPCGEQVLPIGGVCLLGSMNLTQFIDYEKLDWDYEKLENYIPYIVRMMDNVNDKTYVPLEYQQENLTNKRRIGLGVMGYGSALTMLKIRYGSEKAISMTEKLMRFIANNAYKASALLAKEKGAFKLFNADEYLKSNFIQSALDDDTIELIKKYGIRNSHLLSIQPTGNCVRKNTKIKTDRGCLSMDKIFKLNNIDINHSEKNRWYIPMLNIEVDTLFGRDRITGLYINDSKDILSIKTDNKNIIEGTFEHKVLVKIDDKTAEWRELRDVKVGDKILLKG